MSNVKVRGVNDRPEPLIVRRRGVSCPLVHVLSSSNSTMVNQEGNIEKREWRDGERELRGEGEDGKAVCVFFLLVLAGAWCRHSTKDTVTPCRNS